VRLVISDLGGVVVDNADAVPAIAAELGMTAEAFRALMGEDTRFLMEGTITPHEFWSRFRDRTGREVEQDLWEREFRPRTNPAVLTLLDRVRRRARVVAGTNTMEPHWPALQRLGLLASFDAVYASHRMGLVKPDPRFYGRILAEEGCPPAEALFFDDVLENVAGARKAGITAWQFRDPGSLESALRSCGLLNGRP